MKQTSFQRDYEKNAGRCEKDIFIETIIELGKKYNIDVDVTSNNYKQLV